MKVDKAKVLGIARTVAIGIASSVFFGAVDQYARSTVQEFLKKRRARIEDETNKTTTNNG